MTFDRISVDDPDKDRKIIRENFLKELYNQDKIAVNNDKPNIFTIKEIWQKTSFKAYSLSYVEKIIKEICKDEDPEIELINYQGEEMVRLVDKKRKMYSLSNDLTLKYSIG